MRRRRGKERQRNQQQEEQPQQDGPDNNARQRHHGRCHIDTHVDSDVVAGPQVIGGGLEEVDLVGHEGGHAEGGAHNVGVAEVGKPNGSDHLDVVCVHVHADVGCPRIVSLTEGLDDRPHRQDVLAQVDVSGADGVGDVGSVGRIRPRVKEGVVAEEGGVDGCQRPFVWHVFESEYVRVAFIPVTSIWFGIHITGGKLAFKDFLKWDGEQTHRNRYLLAR